MSAQLNETVAMRRFHRISWIALVVMLVGSLNSSFAVAQDEWTDDATAAAKLAGEKDRDMLLLFTGSDWCPPCIKLEKAVLGKEDFLKKASKDFVLVKFDFPEEKQLPEKVIEQNNAWATKLGIESFPTLALVDKSGKPYAFTAFREEGPTEYLAHLKELQNARVARDKFMKQAEKAKGLDRARFLDQALALIDPTIVEIYYAETVTEIGELDKEDEGGLRTKYFAARDREIRKAVMSNISMVARLRKPDEAIAFIDEAISLHMLPTDMLLLAQSTKLRLLRGLKKSDEANALIDSMKVTEGISGNAFQRLVINKAYYLVSLKQNDAALAELDKYISTTPENLLMTVAKGELHDSMDQFELAIKSYDKAIVAAAAEPEVLVDVVGAKADAQVELKLIDQALATLDGMANNEGIPGRLRAESLLHKSLILREAGRRRAAILSENRAVEIVDSIEEKAGIQKLVDQFRRKFGKSGESGE